MADFYPWLKAFHIISVIAWLAGLFYLPRLFVYHCDAPKGSAQSDTFKTMEHRLLRAIMTPAMIASWVFGTVMIAASGGALWHSGWWLHTKLVLVLGLTGLHFYLARCVRLFAGDRNRHGARFYRVINEVPTLIVVAVVILAVVKPI